MKPWKITLLVLAVAIPVGAVFVAKPLLAFGGHFGHGWHGGGGHHGRGMTYMSGRMMDHVSDELDLTDQQRTEIETILTSAHDEVHARRDEFHAAKDGIHDLLMADDYNEADVTAFADEQATLVAELIVLGTRTLHEAKAVLTPEQQVRLQELHDERRQLHEEHRQIDENWHGQHSSDG